METKLHEINVTLSRDQKKEILKAYINKGRTFFYLYEDALSGNDTLLVPEKSIKWDENNLISDKETFLDYTERMTFKNGLHPKTYSEVYNNDFYLVPSMNDKGLKKFRVHCPETIIDKLEKARKKNEALLLYLDYSLITKKSEEYSVMENLRELMENH